MNMKPGREQAASRHYFPPPPSNPQVNFMGGINFYPGKGEEGAKACRTGRGPGRDFSHPEIGILNRRLSARPPFLPPSRDPTPHRSLPFALPFIYFRGNDSVVHSFLWNQSFGPKNIVSLILQSIFFRGLGNRSRGGTDVALDVICPLLRRGDFRPFISRY